MRGGADGLQDVVVETNLDLLQLGGQVDLLDTPGVGSDTHLDAVTAGALRSLDAVVLVIRYPALFTQFTRQLATHLDHDIGKLFVVWNLDAACAELTAADKNQHAEGLRSQLTGARDLFPVDARAALLAQQGKDNQALQSSGMSAFSAALSA